MSDQPDNHDLGTRFYLSLLSLYPSSFRQKYADEMLLCFRDARRATQAGLIARANFWFSMLFDVVRSAFQENWQNLFHPMNSKPNGSGAFAGFIKTYPFGTGAIVLSLACAIGLGIRMRHYDFSDAAYLLVMAQVTVLSAIVLISGFIVDIENKCLNKLGRELLVGSLLLNVASIAVMTAAIHQLQHFELTIEELLPIVLQIVIFGTLWCQLICLNDIRILHPQAMAAHRDERAENSTPANHG